MAYITNQVILTTGLVAVGVGFSLCYFYIIKDNFIDKMVDGLFDAFTQADASTTREFGGTGLGLSITRELVRLMGGDISVESQVGAGTRFLFTLALGAARSTPRSYASLAGKRVLAVDDNATNRAVLARYLERLEMDCQLFAEPHELLDAFNRDPSWQFLILDMHMPEMDGLQLAAEVRKAAHAHGTSPVLLLLSNCPQQLPPHSPLQLAVII